MLSQDRAISTLFVDTLKDIYSAEKQIFRSLPKLARAARSDALREAFETHRDQTQDQIDRLEQIFEMIGKRPRGPECEAMKGILEEGEETMEEFKASEALDAGLIASAQTVEHYEINRYSALAEWARDLDLDEAANLLAESLREEKETDELLTEIAEAGVNASAESDGSAAIASGGRTNGKATTKTASTTTAPVQKRAAQASGRESAARGTSASPPATISAKSPVTTGTTTVSGNQAGSPAGTQSGITPGSRTEQSSTVKPSMSGSTEASPSTSHAGESGAAGSKTPATGTADKRSPESTSTTGKK